MNNTQNNSRPTSVNKSWDMRLRKVPRDKSNKKTWFQNWLFKIARAFGLDAVQGSHSNKKTWFQNWLLSTISYRGTEQNVEVLRRASTTDKNRKTSFANSTWCMCLSKVLGSQEKRESRISSTVNELRTQLTQQFAKSAGGASGSARRQAGAAHVPGGFTIIELLIATAVFSIVLMTALAGFLQIGRLFYQGVSTTQTQTVVNQLFQDIVGNFQTAANISSLQSTNGYTYYCIGNSRYTYNIGKKVILADSPNHAALASGGNFGLLKDILPGATACAPPCNDLGGGACSAGTVPFKSPIELLGDNMRVESFNLQQNPNVGPNFYNVSVVIAYGDDDLLDYTNPKDHSTVFCKSGSFNQQFCAVSRLDSGVYRGQGP